PRATPRRRRVGCEGLRRHPAGPLHAQPATASAAGGRAGCRGRRDRVGPRQPGGTRVRPRAAVRTQSLTRGANGARAMDELKTVSDLCLEHRLDAKQLAERAGLDEQRVLAIVLGRWTPSPAERDKIAAVFGRTRDKITWGHKTPIQHIYGH